MLPKYRQWIDEHVPDRETAYGNCAEVTLQMAEVFPELKRIRGHYNCLIWGERPHWWCVAEDGSIVDPTSKQFPSGGIGEYRPWVEGTPEPTGRCPNCGGLCYDGDSVCSDRCGDQYTNYLMAECGRF